MNHYCTLFDSNYLTRGLSLHASLEATSEQYHLYVFCFDELACESLKKLSLAHVTIIRMNEFETPALLSVKGDRNPGEYCWTCTPHIIRHVLDRYRAPEVTYLDADLFFFQKPSLLLDEWHAGGGSVLLTEHRFAPEYDNPAAGRYCVQFMGFKADLRGLEALQWWQDRCIEWCYNRVEDGKFGDQKYLDDWLTRFEGVHVLQHLGGGVAPWNVSQYKVASGPCVDGVPIVFYHFHRLRWFTDGRFDLSGYKLSDAAVELIYLPYLASLKESLARAQKAEPGFRLGLLEPPTGPRSHIEAWKRRIEGTYRVVSS